MLVVRALGLVIWGINPDIFQPLGVVRAYFFVFFLFFFLFFSGMSMQCDAMHGTTYSTTSCTCRQGLYVSFSFFICRYVDLTDRAACASKKNAKERFLSLPSGLLSLYCSACRLNGPAPRLTSHAIVRTGGCARACMHAYPSIIHEWMNDHMTWQWWNTMRFFVPLFTHVHN